jgi:hypothetical protein
MISGDILQLCGIVLLIAVSSTLARFVLKQQMRAIGVSTGGAAPRTLAPTEIAYLLRDGDMPHTLIVMTVDLVHRQVKAPDQNGPIPLREYEKQVWVGVKDFLKQLAEQKAGHLVPVSDFKNPVKWAMRFNALKTFVAQTLRGFITELIQDPRHIKKYFTAAGIARLALHFYTSGVRQAVERELRLELLQDGFLVPEARRKKFATYVVLLVPLTVAALFFLPFGAVKAAAALAFCAFGFINALLIRLLVELPGIILRLTLVRILLRLLRVGLGAIVTVVSLVLLAIEVPLLGLISALGPMSTIPLLVALTVLGFSVVAALLDWHALTMREQPTAMAQDVLKQTKTNVAHIRPLDTFKRLFADPDYDRTFSEVVAVYGVETLWLLS